MKKMNGQLSMTYLSRVKGKLYLVLLPNNAVQYGKGSMYVSYMRQKTPKNPCLSPDIDFFYFSLNTLRNLHFTYREMKSKISYISFWQGPKPLRMDIKFYNDVSPLKFSISPNISHLTPYIIPYVHKICRRDLMNIDI